MTDVRIRQAGADFREVILDHPLRLAGATVDRFTLAVVTAEVETADGRSAEGSGASVLSVPWAWPRSPLSWHARDQTLRDMVTGLCADAGSASGDPLEICAELETRLSGPRGVPRLAASLVLGAVDNAVHDGWARAAGRPAAGLYPEALADTRLSALLKEGLGEPRTRLPVQHVVGVGDSLDEVGAWLERDGIRHVKVKVAGQDPRADAARITAIHALLGGGGSVSVDPNEGCRSAAGAAAMLDALPSGVLADVAYLEQPVPRDAPPDPDGMRELARRVPVLADESLAGVADLDRLAEGGWSGVVVKAAKGQSLALRSWAYAREHGLAVMIQDLTAVDLALAHSARLAATLPWSWPPFECNSRQYAPRANDGLAFMAVQDGQITLEPHYSGIR
ncbi:enolase C-terminal domain-like protein [Nonomuraea sp. NPDC050547]|uniref:enolase C-terminal domain-like protein n=1 Tax=Nonomuraea sp. NPDC050547 TaxID=3364368 RepID=UPI00378A00C7